MSLAAALALPLDFPARNLILLLTFAVILVTLVGQGLTLPLVVRWVRWDGVDGEQDEVDAGAGDDVPGRACGSIRLGADTLAEPPAAARAAGVGAPGPRASTSRPRTPRRPSERQQEHLEHEEIQLSVINAQRGAVIALRDAGEINDATLRLLERELDLEELRMEA